MSTGIVAKEERSQVLATKTQEAMVKFQDRMQANARKLVAEILMNMPDYSTEWIRCKKWDYDKGTYVFKVEDPDEEGTFVEHEVTVDEVAQAVPLLYIQVNANPSWMQANCGMDPGDFFDAGCWDLIATDILMQTYFYGTTVFG
jgi:hypothetical protein